MFSPGTVGFRGVALLSRAFIQLWKERKNMQKISAFVLLLLSLLLAAGVKTFAAPCPVRPMLPAMACHWAGMAAMAVGITCCLLSVILLCSSNRGTKQGLALAIALDGVLGMGFTGPVISLCNSTHMRCHLYMKPFIIVMGILLLGTATFTYFALGKAERENKA